MDKLIAIVRDEADARLPDVARQVLQVLAAQIEQLEVDNQLIIGGLAALQDLVDVSCRYFNRTPETGLAGFG